MRIEFNSSPLEVRHWTGLLSSQCSGAVMHSCVIKKGTCIPLVRQRVAEVACDGSTAAGNRNGTSWVHIQNRSALSPQQSSTVTKSTNFGFLKVFFLSIIQQPHSFTIRTIKTPLKSYQSNRNLLKTAEVQQWSVSEYERWVVRVFRCLTHGTHV